MYEHWDDYKATVVKDGEDIRFVIMSYPDADTIANWVRDYPNLEVKKALRAHKRRYG